MQAALYFVANDAILTWVVPFLRSARMANRDLPMICIPYNDDIDEISSLCEEFKFNFVDCKKIKSYDTLLSLMHPKATPHKRHHMRKLYPFFGPADVFLLIDVDVVIFQSASPYLKAAKSTNRTIFYSEVSSRLTYRKESLREIMASKYKSVEFNSGLLISRNNILSESDIQKVLRSDLFCEFRDQYDPGLGDQPGINFIMDILNIEKRSLEQLYDGYSSLSYIGNPAIRKHGEAAIDARDGRPLFMAHWAGIKEPNPSMEKYDLYQRFA